MMNWNGTGSIGRRLPEIAATFQACLSVGNRATIGRHEFPDITGYLNLRPEQSNAFFKLMHERYAKRSTIITTNLDYPQWYDFLGNKKMVKALLDRLRHRCHTIRIQGESLREPQG